MTTAAPSTALATIQPAFTDPERLALAGPVLKASDTVDARDELTSNFRHLSVGDIISLHGGHAETVAVLDHLSIADGQCRSQIRQIWRVAR